MKDYVTTAVIWQKNLPVEIGTTVRLSDVAARYLQHALKEVKPDVAPSVEPVLAEEVAEVETPKPAKARGLKAAPELTDGSAV